MSTSTNKGMNHFLLLLLVLAIIFSIFTVVRLSSMGLSLQTFFVGNITPPPVVELPKDGSFPELTNKEISSLAVTAEDGEFVLHINGALIGGESPEQPAKLSMSTLMQGLTASGNAYAASCPAGQTKYCWGPLAFNGNIYAGVCWCQ